MIDLLSTLRSFDRAQRGTALTEFVIALPVFIVLFIGIVELSEMLIPLPKTEAQAHREVFDRALEVQSMSLIESGFTHTLPTVAGANAIDQTIEYEPRQPGLYREAILLAEQDTYSFGGLALSGHLGESFARTRIIRILGVDPAGVSRAIEPHSGRLVGGSYLGRQIVDDGPNTNFNGDQITANSESTVEAGVSLLNDVLNASGMRAPLAAGIRYGTVSAEVNETVSTIWDQYDYSAWYTVTVGPYASENVWNNQMRATIVSRLTLADHRIYNNLGAFSGDPTRLGISEKQNRISVPRADQVELVFPLDYDADLHD